MKIPRSSVKGFMSKVLSIVWIAAGFIIAAVALTSCRPAEKAAATCSYAEDRALIEDLQSRYMFALDFGDLDSYVATFTEEGILDIGEGEWRGRDSIRHILASMPRRDNPPAAPGTPELHRSTGRHAIANIVLKIEGTHHFTPGRSVPVFAHQILVGSDIPDRISGRHGARLAYFVSHAPEVKMLKRPLGEILSFRNLLKLGAPLDDGAGNATQSKVYRKSNADRPTAHDNDWVPFPHTRPLV